MSTFRNIAIQERYLIIVTELHQLLLKFFRIDVSFGVDFLVCNLLKWVSGGVVSSFDLFFVTFCYEFLGCLINVCESRVIIIILPIILILILVVLFCGMSVLMIVPLSKLVISTISSIARIVSRIYIWKQSEILGKNRVIYRVCYEFLCRKHYKNL